MGLESVDERCGSCHGHFNALSDGLDHVSWQNAVLKVLCAVKIIMLQDGFGRKAQHSHNVKDMRLRDQGND